MKRTTTRSLILGQFFDTMIVASKSKCWKLFWATLTCIILLTLHLLNRQKLVIWTERNFRNIFSWRLKKEEYIASNQWQKSDSVLEIDLNLTLTRWTENWSWLIEGTAAERHHWNHAVFTEQKSDGYISILVWHQRNHCFISYRLINRAQIMSTFSHFFTHLCWCWITCYKFNRQK